MIFNRVFGITTLLLLSFSRYTVLGSARFAPSDSSPDDADCRDVEGWHDSHGADFDCDFYQAEGKEYCELVGDMHGNSGLTANRACCVCGGGVGPATNAGTGWQLFMHRPKYFWAVNSVELYSSSDCSVDSRIQIPNSASFFDSGSRGENWGPERPFLHGLRWAGRKDPNGNFYLGVKFDAPVTVRCLRINQNGRGVPRIMVLAQKSSTAPWENVKYATDLGGGWSTVVLDGGKYDEQTTLSTDPTTTATTSSAETTATAAETTASTAATTSSVEPSGSGPSRFPPSGNPIQVPASLLPRVTGATPGSPDLYCRYLDLTSIKPPPNPGYADEAIENMLLSGDDIWETSFYMMLYSNCERQTRGLSPFSMWDDDAMLRLQPTYVFESGHRNFGERADIVGGVMAEGAGGGQRVGAPMPSRRIAKGDDNIVSNGFWDPAESARVAVAGLVNHGDAMRDSKYTCVWATVTLGPEANNWMSAILLYGRSC